MNQSSDDVIRDLKQKLADIDEKVPEKLLSDKWSIGLGLFCAAAGGILAFLPGPVKIDLFLGFVTVPLSYIVYEQSQRGKQFIKAERSNAKLEIELSLLRAELRSFYTNVFSVGNYATKLEKLNKLDPVLQATGLHVLGASLDAVWASERRSHIQVKGREAAGISYQHFWEQVNDQVVLKQEELRRKPIARITHASDIGDWYHDQSERINDLHTKFKRHGTVFRILIDRARLEPFANDGKRDALIDRRVKQYRSLMEKMEQKGVHVAYIHASMIRTFIESYADHDFCIVSEFDYSAVWELSSQMKVKTFTLTTMLESYQKNIGIWEDLTNYAENFDYHSDYFSSDDAVFFRKSRDSFIKATKELTDSTSSATFSSLHNQQSTSAGLKQSTLSNPHLSSPNQDI